MKKLICSLLSISFLLLFVQSNWAGDAFVADSSSHVTFEIQYKGNPVKSAYFKDTLDIYCAFMDSVHKGEKMRFYAGNRLIFETAYDSVFPDESIRINRKIREKIPFDEDQFKKEVKFSIGLDTENILAEQSVVLYSQKAHLTKVLEPGKIEGSNINDRIGVNFNTHEKAFRERYNKIYLNKLHIANLQAELFFKFNNNINPENSLDSILTDNLKDQVISPVFIGSSGNNKYLLDSDFRINNNKEKNCLLYISWGTLIFLIIIIILIAIFTEKNYKKGFFSIIKDKSNSERPTFSLSRTQMAFWTLIVIISFFYVWISKGEMISFSEDVLILLGISATTVAGANFIDKKDERKALQNNTRRHQDTESKGFFSDILSDEASLSIHRFQQVLFNIVIGGFFIYKVCVTYIFPEIDSIIMILLGISNATYLTVKSTENSKL
jgi:hypothetical protein